MKTIQSISEIKGSNFGLGSTYIITLSDGSKVKEIWETLHNKYNEFDETIGKYGDYKVPTTEWKVESIIGKNWEL